MRHLIIVKYTDAVRDRAALERDIRALFAPAASMPGVNGVQVLSACLTGGKRYDLMIEMNMSREALAAFDASEIHARWKRDFGAYVLQKTIFDCE